MKLLLLIIVASLFSMSSIAQCRCVYTIGAYDEAFKNHVNVIKLGPLAAADVPPILPKAFLEKEGSYGGGEAFCTIKKACQTLTTQLSSGVLPKTENWHVYLLDADWNRDTYQLHPSDYRISHPVKVLSLARQTC